MQRLCFNDVTVLNADARHFHAGALDFILGGHGRYGIHYGMRSTRARAIDLFQQGFAAAADDYRNRNA